MEPPGTNLPQLPCLIPRGLERPRVRHLYWRGRTLRIAPRQYFKGQGVQEVLQEQEEDRG